MYDVGVATAEIGEIDHSEATLLVLGSDIVGVFEVVEVADGANVVAVAESVFRGDFAAVWEDVEGYVEKNAAGVGCAVGEIVEDGCVGKTLRAFQNVQEGSSARDGVVEVRSEIGGVLEEETVGDCRGRCLLAVQDVEGSREVRDDVSRLAAAVVGGVLCEKIAVSGEIAQIGIVVAEIHLAEG